MPFVQPYGRVIALDHIGHGKSDKPDVEYKFADYVKYMDGFLDALNLTNITFVIHDWGSVLGLYYAARFPNKVRGVAMMEALCAPFYPITSIAEALKRPGKASAVKHYQLYKSDEAWDLAVKQNMFIEEVSKNKLWNVSNVVPASSDMFSSIDIQVMMLHTHRKLSQREMDAYRDPFRKEEWRKPLFMWAREVSLEGDCPFTDEAMVLFNKWLLETDIPILDVYGMPGEVSEEYDIKWRAERLKNHEAAFIGVALHFVQEDQPYQVGRAIADWYRRNLAKDCNVWFTNALP